MQKYYLFKRAADDQWIFGQNADCEHPAGMCRIVPSTDRTKVSIIYLHKSEANLNIMDEPVTNFYNELDLPYANFAALKAAYAGFFFRSVGGGIGNFITTADGQYYPYVTDPNFPDVKVRFGVRNANAVMDITLTATGFDGVENTDWQFVAGSGS